MAVVHGKAAAMLIDEFNLTGYARKVAINLSVDIHDATVFGSNSKIKHPGLSHGTLSGEAFHDEATGASYASLKAAFASGSSSIISFYPAGYVLGSRALLLYSLENDFKIETVVDQLNILLFGAEASEDAIDIGISLHALAAETATGNGTSSDNAALTSNGGVAHLHVTATAGASPSTVVKIQHSANDSTWADLVTFAAATAATKERVEVAAGTTVNRYLRTVHTLGGSTTSITYADAFARR